MFGLAVTERMREKHGILINGKWHRFTFSNALTISEDEIKDALQKFVDCFTTVASSWTRKKRNPCEKNSF